MLIFTSHLSYAGSDCQVFILSCSLKLKRTKCSHTSLFKVKQLLQLFWFAKKNLPMIDIYIYTFTMWKWYVCLKVHFWRLVQGVTAVLPCTNSRTQWPLVGIVNKWMNERINYLVSFAFLKSWQKYRNGQDLICLNAFLKENKVDIH